MSEPTTPAELLARLVGFDTTSHKSNRDLVRFVADYLDGFGVKSRVLPTPEGDKANLFATIGDQEAGGIALSGHTDVVPVDGQAWENDPFTVTRRGDRLHGRGAADMKGFLACVLAAVPDFTRRSLRTPIHVVFSHDEEIGCIGVRPLIARFGRDLPRPRLVVVGEPTEMRVVDAHKGPLRWRVEVTGRAAHSSMATLGVNAITVAGRLLAELDDVERDLRNLAPTPRFDPPYSTLQVTRITGGTATNVVPASCEFSFDVRALPGFDADKIEDALRAFAADRLLPEMRRVAPESDIRVARMNEVAPFAADPESEAVRLALAWTGETEPRAVSYATEAGLFQAAGLSTVVCGPGSIAQAHTADEWIAASELDRCMAFLGRIADWAEAA